MGTRMKEYEREYEQTFKTGSPVLARIDGRCFSKFTKFCSKPFSQNLHDNFVETVRALMRETGADIGYTQSDEITLMWLNDRPDGQLWFGGKVQKMVSSLSAFTTAKFNELVKPQKFAMFDARVWQIEDHTEVMNSVLWRVIDCDKNAVSALAHHIFSHNELQGKHKDQMLDMLNERQSIDQNSAMIREFLELKPFRQGTFISKAVHFSHLSEQEREELPEKHNVHKFPDLMIKRAHYVKQNIPFATMTYNDRMNFLGLNI